ncbi:hypothetical protein AVEN_273483-1 [Araneus ventricosus]|uniref:Uncharacterized protein n=1 Tax=Araneus ventricosus TaxID=182803 RepID=A0A4Y2NZI8_ARAVE|nr:hypothetical protein AVEN_273483-1 [Araneus ventricosus]
MPLGLIHHPGSLSRHGFSATNTALSTSWELPEMNPVCNERAPCNGSRFAFIASKQHNLIFTSKSLSRPGRHQRRHVYIPLASRASHQVRRFQFFII